MESNGTNATAGNEAVNDVPSNNMNQDEQIMLQKQVKSILNTNRIQNYFIKLMCIFKYF